MNKSLLFLLLTAGLSQQVLASDVGIGEEEKEAQKKTMRLVFDAEDKRLDTFHDGLPALPKEIWQLLIAKDFSVQDHYHLCLTHPYFYALFSHFPGVHRLTFTQGKKANPPQGLSHFSCLQKVTIGKKYPHLRTVLQNLPVGLESLNLYLSCVPFEEEDLVSLSQIALQRLRLSSCTQVTGQGLRFLSRIPLQELKLPYCRSLTDEGLRHLPHNLERLDLTDTQVTDEGLKYLPSSLEKLTLHRTRVTDAGLGALLSRPSLKKLGLNDTRVTDKGLKDLPNSLERLNLRGTPVTGAGLECLPSSLEKLTLHRTRVTDAGLGALLSRPSLKKLSISNCHKITDTGLTFLPPSLEVLDLGWAHITNDGLKFLSQRLLKELGLRSCRKLTNEGLMHLPGGLQTLNLVLHELL